MFSILSSLTPAGPRGLFAAPIKACSGRICQVSSGHICHGRCDRLLLATPEARHILPWTLHPDRHDEGFRDCRPSNLAGELARAGGSSPRPSTAPASRDDHRRQLPLLSASPRAAPFDAARLHPRPAGLPPPPASPHTAGARAGTGRPHATEGDLAEKTGPLPATERGVESEWLSGCSIV